MMQRAWKYLRKRLTRLWLLQPDIYLQLIALFHRATLHYWFVFLVLCLWLLFHLVTMVSPKRRSPSEPGSQSPLTSIPKATSEVNDSAARPMPMISKPEEAPPRGSPVKRVKTNPCTDSNPERAVKPAPLPALRSAIVTTKVKTEAKPVSATPAGDVVDIDADWSSDVPMDFSRSIASALDRVASPPNELTTEIIDLDPEPIPAEAASSAIRLGPPATEIAMSKLRPLWSSCNRPTQNVTKSFLMAEGHLNRVDILVFRAVDQRADTDPKDAEWCRQAHHRFREVHKGFFRVPLSLRCDRSFFERADDALYIEEMSMYLFDDSITTPPVLSNPRLYQVFVPGDRTRALQNRLMWAAVVMRKKVLTNEDFFVARCASVDVNKATVPIPEGEAILTIPWDILPSVPTWVGEAVDLRSAPVSPVRALTFFTNTARDQGAAVYKKWNKALQFELAIHVASAHYAAWARPLIDQTRIWLPTSSHIAWLKKFESLPPVPVFFEVLGKHVSVSIADVVRILEDARAHAVSVKRRDYCTKSQVEFVVTPNSHIYVLDPLREAALRTTTRLPLALSLPQSRTAAVSKPINSATKQSIKLIPAAVTAGRGSMTVKVIKKVQLKKQTSMSSEHIEGLKGSGPFSMAEVVNHLTERTQSLAKSNDTLMSETAQLQEENRRLRDDIMRYRDDASRLSAALRTSQARQDPYDPYDTTRGGPRGGWGSDPYDRSYNYDRRY